MKNKGFTLIELLAVIVILAIIALIATPIILGIINDSKKQSEDRSAELYLDAAKKAIARYQTSYPDKDFSNISECSIDANKITCGAYEIPVEMSGQAPTSGTIKLSNGNVTNGTRIVYGEDKTYNYINGRLVLAEPQGSTDSSCFIYLSEEISMGSNTTIDVQKCVEPTKQFFGMMSGEDVSEIPDEEFEGMCDGTGEMTAEEFMSLSPLYGVLLNQNGALINPEINPLSYSTIAGYTCDDTEIIIPSTLGGKNVTTIGSGAFYNKGLTSVVIPNSVTVIDEAAFADNQLESVTIGNSVTTIGERAFESNQLTNITIPNSVTTIGEDAFEENQLESVTIGNSVTTIGESAFKYNKLTSVTIPNSVTTIGNYAFKENQLTEVVIPNSVTTIGEGAFTENNIETVNIGSGITSIGENAFSSDVCAYLSDNSNACSSSLEGIPEDYQSGEIYGPNALTSVSINNCENSVTVGKNSFGWASGYSAENNLHWKTTGCE